jgi:hypothetical protein
VKRIIPKSAKSSANKVKVNGLITKKQTAKKTSKKVAKKTAKRD